MSLWLSLRGPRAEEGVMPWEGGKGGKGGKRRREEGDKKRARAARGKEKKHLPCVSSRAVVREEHEEDRERKEKEGKS